MPARAVHREAIFDKTLVIKGEPVPDFCYWKHVLVQEFSFSAVGMSSCSGAYIGALAHEGDTRMNMGATLEIFIFLRVLLKKLIAAVPLVYPSGNIFWKSLPTPYCGALTTFAWFFISEPRPKSDWHLSGLADMRHINDSAI